MTFYGQPHSATHYVKFVLLVCLCLAFTFVFSAETLLFAYFILVLLPYVNVNLKTPKVALWHWLGVHGPYFFRSGLLGFTCPAVAHVSYRFINDSCILLMCQ